ncbi:MAG: HAMP domain-containing histidine kinase [Clostridia bacterium]|nr:HAMP domain-containing histidine kinase [Clostridia bacterium]
MKKGRKNLLAIELIGLLIVIMLGLSALIAFMTSLFCRGHDESVFVSAMYLGNGLSMVFGLIVFFFLINTFFTKRIHKLSKAVTEIANGNYDITVSVKGYDELSELAKNINKMTVELKANVMLSKSFTRNVSHEFKTPISVIKSYAQAATDADDKATLENYMKIIVSESDRLANLSKNVLELSRMDSTTIISKEDVFVPAEQIRSAILATQLKWSKKDISVEPDLEEFEIKSNENLLFRVWQNLISNAIKFTEEKGTIAIILKKQESDLLFIIKDNGIGIADEDKDKIFDPFFTGDKSHNKEGSGLGLPLAKTIIEKLGGKISFESERNKGTTFTVCLPL